MQQENIVYYNPIDELDDDLSVNFQNIWKAIWNRRLLLIKIFCSFLAFFIILTFIMPKKYRVTADLYINKANNSNMMEVNPYILNEAGNSTISMGIDKAISNEIELMKSELVLDKVIRDNNIVYKKKYGIIPNKKEGEFLTAEAFYGKGKKLKIENTKNTNVVTIKFKDGNPDFAYGVVSSLITHYIELHKELNTEKSKSDKKLLESEYIKTKENLNERLNQASGLPAQSMAGIGNLSAMSAFSKSASQAIGNIKSQYIAGEKSQIAVSVESQKLTQLATKLEWAKMVEQMSDSSKVLVLKEPKQLRPFENSSPKLLINILLGCLFGCFASFLAFLHVEYNDKKVTYLMLTQNVIYDYINNHNILKAEIGSYNPKKVLILSFAQLPKDVISSLQSIPNANIIFYDDIDNFINNISTADKFVLISKIGITDSESYKMVRKIIKNQGKDIICDVLI